jgi:hypothetical protein
METRMRNQSLLGLIFTALAVAMMAAPGALQAQAAVPTVSDNKMAAYVDAFAEISRLRDDMNAQLARVSNKTDEFQDELREKYRHDVAAIIVAKGLTEQEYNYITWIVSVDQKQRDSFQALLARRSAN